MPAPAPRPGQGRGCQPHPDASASRAIDLPMRAPPIRIAELREIAKSCRRCPLWRNATQTVFGEGPGECAGRLRRRAARRPGGYRRQTFRRAGRQGVRRDTGRGRDRSAQGLRHQRGQAFQVRAARQAPHPCQAQCRRGAGLPLVAGQGADDHQARPRRRARRNRRAVAARQADRRSRKCAARRSSARTG